MYQVPDHSQLDYADDFSLPPDCVGRRYDERLNDAIRLDEARRAALDSSHPDFWNPVEDWWVD